MRGSPKVDMASEETAQPLDAMTAAVVMKSILNAVDGTVLLKSFMSNFHIWRAVSKRDLGVGLAGKSGDLRALL